MEEYNIIKTNLETHDSSKISLYFYPKNKNIVGIELEDNSTLLLFDNYCDRKVKEIFKDYNIVEMNSYIENLIVNKSLEALKRYSKLHINDMKVDNNFIEKYYCDLFSLPSKKHLEVYNIDLSLLKEWKIKVDFNNKFYILDLRTSEIKKIINSSNREDVNLVDALFNDKEKGIAIVQEQYQQKKLTGLIKNLFDFNKYLKDKTSLSIVLKSRRKFEMRFSEEITANKILTYYNKELYIHPYCHSLMPTISNKIKISDVDYFINGKKKFTFKLV